MTGPTNIALLIELSSTHARGLLRGISVYSQAKGPWRLHLIEQLRVSDIRRALDTWDGDGLIARVETDAIAKVLVERGLPVVNVTGTSVIAPWPRVDTDNAAVCRMAAGHLIDRGYHHFGFCGMAQYQWSGWRRDYFAAELHRQGISCSILELASLTSDTRINRNDRRRLARWVANLPRPAGVMACNDHCGRAVLEACTELAVPIPDDIGVTGVDNDDLVCELCFPPLSSIEVNCERIGYAAAEMLDQMLGKADQGGASEKLIRPTTLVRRRSTDATVVRDPFVAERSGFKQASHLSSVFKEKLGLRPGEYRQRVQNRP